MDDNVRLSNQRLDHESEFALTICLPTYSMSRRFIFDTDSYMHWQAFVWVGLGGFIGANTRYALSLWINSRFPLIIGKSIPTGTAFVNVTGSFLLAILLYYATKRAGFPDSAKLLIGTGFFGAYTTFSTYANESINLINDGQWLTGLGYIVGTNLLCLLGVIAGLILANRLF